MKTGLRSLAVLMGAFLFNFGTIQIQAQTNWTSRLFPFNSATGKYEYRTLSANDNWPAQPNWKLQDFSYAGYAFNEKPIPNVPVKITVAPGDSIQAALTQMSTFPKDASGFRGAVLLKAGTHIITNGVSFKCDGVVLRGESPTNTFIYVNNNVFANKAAIAVGGGGSGFMSTGNPSYVISADIKMGDTTASVTNASTLFQPGDHVILTHDRNAAFLYDHNMDGVTYWPDSQCILAWYLVVKSVSGDVITFTEPMTYRLLKSWNSKISKITKQWKNIGIENFSIGFKQGASSADTDWAEAIRISRVTDAWVQNVRTYAPPGATDMLLSHGIVLNDVKCATIQNCNFRKAYNQGGAGNGYLYHTIRCDDILFKNCTAYDGRHNFALNGTSSRIVFQNFVSSGNYLLCDTHRYLNRAILVDGGNFSTPAWSDSCIGFSNRGTESSGSGYTATEAVIWNTKGNSGGFFTSYLATLNTHGRGYAIGTYGSLNSVRVPSDPNTRVFKEGVGKSGLQPSSLFNEQLKLRLASK